MHNTRRRILRAAEDVSTGAAVSTLSPASAFSSGSPLEPPPPWGSAVGPAEFKTGIRVFFIGAWIFLGESDNSGMLAVTRDMGGSMQHTFPYGPWSTFNDQSNLPDNPAPQGQPRNAHQVKIKGFTPIYSSAQDVFDEASNRSFKYITAPNSDLTLDASLSGIRVISLPYPTRIIPADFMEQLDVQNDDPDHPWNKPTNDYGFWAAHIFEYEGDDISLSFEDMTIDLPATDSNANFHFHTRPPQGSSTSHAPMMFKNLMSLVNLDSYLRLVPPPGDLQEDPGPYVPANVTPKELSLVQPADSANSPQQGRKAVRPEFPIRMFIANTASCASSGGGVGGH